MLRILGQPIPDNCSELPFDVRKTADSSQSLLENYGQTTCPVSVNSKDYIRWTGFWASPIPTIYMVLSRMEQRISFSLKMTSKCRKKTAIISLVLITQLFDATKEYEALPINCTD